MQQQGLVPDVSMHSVAISAYGKAKQPYKVMVLLEVMLQKGMMPDVITYNAANQRMR